MNDYARLGLLPLAEGAGSRPFGPTSRGNNAEGVAVVGFVQPIACESESTYCLQKEPPGLTGGMTQKMSLRTRVAWVCFIVVGLVAIVEASLLAHSHFNVRNFSDLEEFVWDYASWFVIRSIFSVFLLVVGLVLISGAAEHKFYRTDLAIVFILSLSVAAIHWTLEPPFHMGVRILPLMTMYGVYGIALVFIAARRLVEKAPRNRGN